MFIFNLKIDINQIIPTIVFEVIRQLTYLWLCFHLHINNSTLKNLQANDNIKYKGNGNNEVNIKQETNEADGQENQLVFVKHDHKKNNKTNSKNNKGSDNSDIDEKLPKNKKMQNKQKKETRGIAPNILAKCNKKKEDDEQKKSEAKKCKDEEKVWGNLMPNIKMEDIDIQHMVEKEEKNRKERRLQESKVTCGENHEKRRMNSKGRMDKGESNKKKSRIPKLNHAQVKKPGKQKFDKKKGNLKGKKNGDSVE